VAFRRSHALHGHGRHCALIKDPISVEKLIFAFALTRIRRNGRAVSAIAGGTRQDNCHTRLPVHHRGVVRRLCRDSGGDVDVGKCSASGRVIFGSRRARAHGKISSPHRLCSPLRHVCDKSISITHACCPHPGLQIEPGLCQEDWGVVVFAQRNGKRFWIGLSSWPDQEQVWLAHFHHHAFAWLQRWTTSGKNELQQLVLAAHEALSGDPAVSHLAWYLERDMTKANAQGSTNPIEG
jgi:hypothetical protein